MIILINACFAYLLFIIWRKKSILSPLAFWSISGPCIVALALTLTASLGFFGTGAGSKADAIFFLSPVPLICIALIYYLIAARNNLKVSQVGGKDRMSIVHIVPMMAIALIVIVFVVMSSMAWR